MNLFCRLWKLPAVVSFIHGPIIVLELTEFLVGLTKAYVNDLWSLWLILVVMIMVEVGHLNSMIFLQNMIISLTL